jgi:hypothetical protein
MDEPLLVDAPDVAGLEPATRKAFSGGCQSNLSLCVVEDGERQDLVPIPFAAAAEGGLPPVSLKKNTF